MSTTPMPMPNQQAPPPEAMTPEVAAPNVPNTPLDAPAAPSNPNAINPANPPAAPPAAPPKHAHLLAMIQGLADGLGAASTSIATHGREGGAQEVQQLQMQRQKAAQDAQAAAQAKIDAETRNKLTTAETTRTNLANIHTIYTAPDEVAKSHMSVQEQALKLTGEAQTQAITGADFQASHGGMKPEEFSKQMDNTTPLSGQGTSVNPFFMNQGQSVLRGAKTANIPDTNPAVQRLTAVLADPKATAKDVFMATQQMQAESDRQGKALEQRTKNEAVRKDELTGGQARIADATWRRQVPKDAQGNPTQDFDTWQKGQVKALEQAITQGDPKVGGQMLAEGTATLSELKARGSTPELIEKEIQWAQKMDPKYNASDEIVGEQTMKNTTNQTFFGSARSLVQQGGMLDQLKGAHDKLGNTKIPTYNKYADWLAYKAGTPELAAYRAAVLGAADDYAKVVGGGNPTDSARQASADQFIYELNNQQFDGAVETSRGAIRSQVEGRIGTNRYVHQREGDILAQSGVSGDKAAPAPTSHVFDSTAWAQKYPKGDLNAEKAYWQKQGYTVK